MKEFIKTNLPFLIPIKRKIFAWVEYLLSIQIQYLPSTDKLGFILTTFFAALIIIFFYQIARKYFGKSYALLISFVLILTPIFQALLIRNDYLLTLVFTLVFLWWTLLQEKIITRLKKILLISSTAGALWQFMFIFYPSIFLPGYWQWQIATPSISIFDIYLVVIEQIRSFLHYPFSFFTPILFILFFLGVVRRKTSNFTIITLLIFFLSYSLNLAGGKAWAIFLPAVLIFGLQSFQALRESKIGFFWKEPLILTAIFFLFFWQNSDHLKKTVAILDTDRIENIRTNALSPSQSHVTFLGQGSSNVLTLVGQTGKVIPLWTINDLEQIQLNDLIVIKADFETHLNTQQKKDIIDNWCVIGWTKQSAWLKPKKQEQCKYPTWKAKPESINLSEKFLLQDYQVSFSNNGKQISVQTLWQRIQETEKDYKIFFQLVGPSWQERSNYPLQGWLKTSDWQPNRRYLDEQLLDFSEAPNGNYVLVIGLYQAPGQDVLVNRETGESFVRLETINVGP